jgi:hypothetical protein
MIYNKGYKCAALVATKDRWNFLSGRALPSIRNQNFLPEIVVLVNDGNFFNNNQIKELTKILAQIPFVILQNGKSPGAAGAWNTGLEYLRKSLFDGYVAILDDDDEWDCNHLYLNISKAIETGAELVVSGLRLIVSGQIQQRQLLFKLEAKDFLCGNPGLQGSNTFVSLQALSRVGNFTEGLPSLNDRDMAFRLLRSKIKTAFTGQWTASWFHDVERKTLSTPRSMEKIIGLQWFWKKYSVEMSNDERAAYLERAWKFFDVMPEEIVVDWGIEGVEVR